MLAAAIGGAVLGFIKKQFPTIPSIPILGRSGTIALGAYFLRNSLGSTGRSILHDVAIAAAGVAGHELGATGTISGDSVMGDVVPQVSGVAAQV